MAMMITRFHKLIQSRTVWYIILGIIVISFVGFFTPTMRSTDKQPREKNAGELFGEKVSHDEYRRAYQNTYIWYILTSGRMMPVNDELAAALQQQAWLRVAALRKAQADQITVADEEIVQQIQRMPVFAGQSGTFDPAVYRAVLQQIGLSAPQVENVFREQIGLYKLMYRPVQAALISPYELKRAYHLYTDRVVLDYAVVQRSEIEKEVAVSREEAEALYAENPDAFRMPDKVRVTYVEFPVANYLDQAEIPEGAALNIYNENIEDYRIESTGEVSIVEYTPFEEVEEDINARLRRTAARRLAAAAAADLVVATSPKAEGEQPDFNGAAAAAGLSVKTLPAFGPLDELESIDPSAPFRQAAFGLQDDAYSSFSDPVVGRDSVYVLNLAQRYESFIPAFDAVEKEALEAARTRAVNVALAQRALEIQTAVQEAAESGKRFRDIAGSFGLTVSTTEEFDVSTELESDYADQLIEISLGVEAGEICEPVPVEDGVLIAYVAERKSTDADLGLPAIRDELIRTLSQSRAQRLGSDWQTALLNEGGFKNFLIRTAE